jgi:Na+/melibiose symporter-like transporter
LVITPIAGALSDLSTHRWGRRKVYLVVCTIIEEMNLN